MINNECEEDKIKKIKQYIETLPISNQATLTILLKHLKKVDKFKEQNQMGICNLAILFGPTLMWPPPNLMSFNTALGTKQIDITEQLLFNFDDIFPCKNVL